MMKRKKIKHHIYTVVVRNKKHHIISSVVWSFVIFLACAFFLPENSENKIVMFYKASLDASLKSGNSFFSNTSYMKLPEINTVMSMVSPVFSGNIKIDYSGGQSPDKDKVSAAPKAKKLSEKNIASKGLEFKNETEYEIDPSFLLQKEQSYNAKDDKPKVLIIHTHGSETYSDDYGTGLGSGGSYRTNDTDINMIHIGKVAADVFAEHGINVIHDKTICDYPSYNTSYVKSLEVIENNLKKYPSIEFVFDLHRDAIANDDGSPVKLCCRIDEKDVSQAMIVCGTDAMGLENPNWRENLSLAFKIQKNLEEMYPGFMRPVNIRKERFNMHKTKGSLLFEVGTHGNTIEEASLAAKYLAEGIAKTISQ